MRNILVNKSIFTMNRQLFELYKNSERGKNVINIFNPDAEDVFLSIEKIIEYAQNWGCTDKPSYVADVCDVLWLNIEEKGMWQGELTRDSYSEFIEKFELAVMLMQ